MQKHSFFSALLSLASLATLTAETNVPATEPSARQTLLGMEANEPFDGSTLSRILFHDNRRTFLFSPPTGWKVRTGDRTDLMVGKYAATISLTVPTGPVAAKAAEADAPETANETPEKAKADDPDLLEMKIAGQAVKKTTTSYERETGRYQRSTIRSLGTDWQVQLSVEGPEAEFAAIEKQLLDSLCSIGVQTEQDMQRVAKDKEREALTEMVQKEKAAARQIPAGRVRGKL